MKRGIIFDLLQGREPLVWLHIGLVEWDRLNDLKPYCTVGAREGGRAAAQGRVPSLSQETSSDGK